MKRQLKFLYVMLVVVLAILVWSVSLMFSIDTEPEVPEDYIIYAQQQKQVLLREDPTDEAEEGIYISFDSASLKAENPDFEGWLMLPDTTISFPVLRTVNNDFYLYRDFYKQYSAYGSLYFDMASTVDAENRVIYGHNMGNNREEMFSPLVAFQDEAYAREHPYVYFAESEHEAADVYELFAVVNFNLVKNLDFNYAQSSFETPEARAEFIAYLKELSIFKTDFNPEGQLLILSTCNRQYGGNNRLLICYGKRNADSAPLSCVEKS